MIFGGHVSSAGGLVKAIERGEEKGFAVIQVFPSSPRTFGGISYPDDAIAEFNETFKKSRVKQLFFHSIYLLNLASSKESLVKLSIKSLIDYLNFGAKVNSLGTIFHIGSSKERTFSEVKGQVVSAFKEILAATSESQNLIMEFAAGAGNVVGDSLEEMAELFTAVNSSRLKLALDTQHLFASGVNVADKQLFREWLAKFDKQIGIENLVAVHTNDSKTELGSHRDRHENIGEGLIGREGFRNILSQPLLQDKPFILEVPGIDGKGPDKENLQKLKGISLQGDSLQGVSFDRV